MLTLVSEELPDVPFYYEQDRLHSMMRVPTGKLTVMRSALLNAGYRVSLSHANKKALKTDAPNSFIWKILRAVVRQVFFFSPLFFWIVPANPKVFKTLSC